MKTFAVPFLYWFCSKEPNEFIKVMKNTLYLWIAFLNNYRYIIIYFLIMQNRNLHAKTFMLIVLIKPFGKKTCSHSLPIITSLTLIKKYVRIRQEEFFYYTLHCFPYLGVIRRILIVFVEYSKLIGFLVLPNILVLNKLYAILNTVICQEPIRTILTPYFVWRVEIETSYIKDLHNNLQPLHVLLQILFALLLPTLFCAESYLAAQLSLPHESLFLKP